MGHNYRRRVFDLSIALTILPCLLPVLAATAYADSLERPAAFHVSTSPSLATNIIANAFPSGNIRSPSPGADTPPILRPARLPGGKEALPPVIPEPPENIPTPPPAQQLPLESVQPAPEKVPSAQPTPAPVTLFVNKTFSIDMDVIQWPDGKFSLPIKAFVALFGMTAQQSADQRLFWIDPDGGKRVEIDWGKGLVRVNDAVSPSGSHLPVFSTDGLVVGDDVYVEDSLLADWFQAHFSYDPDTTTLNLTTDRRLKGVNSDAANTVGQAAVDTVTIQHPALEHKLIEKIFVRNNSVYGFQDSRAPGLGGTVTTTLNSLIDNPTVGVSGTLFGQSYYLKPAFVRYNNQLNFQGIDWSIQHELKHGILSLGNTEAGLSPLAAPTLGIWALKWASRNATTPFLAPKGAYEFSGKAHAGNRIDLRLNGTTVQSVTAADNDTYEMEAVYLQPQRVNHVEVVETDDQNHQTILSQRNIGAFQNLLARGDSAYSTFLGRIPVRFYPLLPDQKTPLLLPQSEKWLTGGRAFYGVNNRLTVGLSAVADRNFGKPHTYFETLNPLSLDLTGYSSYQRDPNFFSGENLTATLRYQVTDRWQLSADAGLGRFHVKNGSPLDFSSGFQDGKTGAAEQLHLERQGSLASWYVEAFNYGSNYYTPATSLFGNTLYDKRGLGAGLNGNIRRFLNLSYNASWNGYQTNLQQLIPGGIITAQHWNAIINSQLNERNNIALSFNWLDGTNQAREFLQRAYDISWRTQSLPWGISGEVRAGHYYTNTLFFPSRTLGTQLIEAEYTNNSLDTSLNIPLGRTGQNRLRIGNRLSTFVDYGYAQLLLQWRQFFIEPLAQISYGDRPQTQNRIGLRLGMLTPGGGNISVGYYKYDSTFSNSLLGSSRIHTDQYTVDFSDVLALLGRRLQSLGPNAETVGGLTGTVFADYVPDHKQGKTEPGIPKVKLLLDKSTPITTDVNGRYRFSGLGAGYHTIEVLPDDLPLTLGADNPVYRIRITEGKTHHMDIALIHEGGSLRGRLQLVDIQGQSLPTKGLILVLTGPEGRVVNYTSPDADGRYRFTNLPAGNYGLDLEAQIKNSGRYKVLQAPATVTLPTPARYDETKELKDLNFKILAL